MHRSWKPARVRALRGFESHPLRHLFSSAAIFAASWLNSGAGCRHFWCHCWGHIPTILTTNNLTMPAPLSWTIDSGVFWTWSTAISAKMPERAVSLRNCAWSSARSTDKRIFSEDALLTMQVMVCWPWLGFSIPVIVLSLKVVDCLNQAMLLTPSPERCHRSMVGV